MRGKLIKKSRAKSLDNKAGQHDELVATKKRLLFGLVIAGVGLLVIIAAVLWPSQKNPSPSSAVITDTCSENNTVTYKCYKDELTKITNEHGPEKAMALVKEQYSKVPYVKSQCHQLTHAIGRAALNKYDTVADTYAHGDQYCWSGYYHGAMEEVAIKNGYDYIIENASNICAPIAAKERNSFYHYNCVHGLGHGLMFVKDGNLFEALKSCDSISDSWERTSCYGGVYMQNIMNEQTPDKDSRQVAHLKPSEPMYPCTAVDFKYKDQCYLMQTSYALQVVGYDFKKVFKLCSEVDKEFRNTCYMSLGRDASGNSISNVQQTKTNCLLGPTDEAQRFCVEGAAKDFVSYFHSDQQAKELCNSLPNNLSSECLSIVENYYASF